jgi:polysaccharide export outer membrane protein
MMGMAGALLFLSAAAARSEYRLQSGDALEIGISSNPEFRQRATVGIDGELTLPFFGPVHVDGLLASEVREKIKDVLSRTPVRRRTLDGRDALTNVEAKEISVEIVHVPVYISGDVSKPGEYAFRPGMTVLQAVALAGGYDLVRFRTSNPFLDSADQKAEYETLSIELMRLRTAMTRIQAELDGKSELRVGASAADVPARTASEITRWETEQLGASVAGFQKEKVHLERELEQTQLQIAQLNRQQEVQQKSLQDASSDLVRVRGLAEKGFTPITRVEEERRFVTQVSDRLFQAGAELALVQRTSEDLKLRLDTVVHQRQLALLKEAEESQVRMAAAQSRLEAAMEKLLYTGIIKSQLRGSGGEPDITVVRKANGNRVTSAENENTELLPGDVVLITLKLGNPTLARSLNLGSTAKNP